MASSATPDHPHQQGGGAVVSVPAGELTDLLPTDIRSGGNGGERMINLPCRELFSGNIPRLPIGLLRDLAPDLIQIPEGRDAWEKIPLPAGWIALHFRMTAEGENPDVMTGRRFHAEGATTPAIEISLPEEVAEPVPPDFTARKGFLATLPIFKRNESSRGVIEGGSDESSSDSAPAILERLWKLDPGDEIAEGQGLQALFMTDEKLTLEKVISKAGELPGLDACVLAHGDRVLCASKSSSETDLQALSEQAVTMLSHIRDSAGNMGLGSVPAVTIHAERGMVSFLHQGELCLLVLHAGRGFVPGVMERLQEMLGHLASARPALGSSSVS